MYNNILHCTYMCKIFPRLPNVCYCTAYYNIETFIFLHHRLFIKKNMANQYIIVNESYRIIISIISSHFSFLLSQTYLSMSFKVINNIVLYYHIFCDIVVLYFF